MYEADLRAKTPMVDALVPLAVVVHDRPAEVGILPAALTAARTGAGEVLFVGYCAHVPVAYLWAATRECWIGEIDDRLQIQPGEVYLYDAYTRSDWRGKRIYPHLIGRAVRHFKTRSWARAMIFATRRNAASMRSIVRCGFDRYATVRYRNLMGWRSWKMEIGERHVRSRLRLEN